MMEPPSSLQVTALLDELLGVAPRREEDEEVAAPEASDAPSPIFPNGSGSPNAAQLSQICGEIEELNTEMDACIASIGRWEEESRQRREALERELERCYASGRESLVAEVEGLSEDLHEDLCHLQREELERELEVSRPASPARPVLPDGSDRRATPGTPLASAEQMLEAAAREAAEDEARIAQLQAEVEQLRCCQQARFSSQSTADADLSPAGLGGPNPFRQLEDDLPSDMDMDSEINELEGRLQDARNYIGHVEEAIGETNFSVDAEINELEQLLNECDAARAQMGPAVA